MGRIFGISDNPVSTIDKVLHAAKLEVPDSVKYGKPIVHNTKDSFVSKEKQTKSNAFIKMRNGFGKLMSHFSKNDKNKSTQIDR